MASTIRMVRPAKRCLDEGEAKDFQDDLDYFMDTLGSETANTNLKCLSMIRLTKKCATFEFRRYLRTQQPVLQKLINLLEDSHENHSMSICVAAFLYMMARDAAQFPSIAAPLRLLYEFLKQERIVGDAEYQKYQPMVWEIICEWKKDCEKRKGRRIIFDLTERSLTPASVALVTLDYVVARSPTKNQALQAELLRTGLFVSLVAKVDKVVSNMRMQRNPTEEVLRQQLSELEHSFRIFENGIMLDKRNQTFVVGHRQGALLFSCEKYLDYFCNEVANHEIGDRISRPLFDCLSLMIRAMMNASHANEVCALKLGRTGNFLTNSLHVLSSIIPRFAEKEKQFDLMLLLCGLLVNLTEKSDANRRKLSNARCEFYALLPPAPAPTDEANGKKANGSEPAAAGGSKSGSQSKPPSPADSQSSNEERRRQKRDAEKRECAPAEELPALDALARVFLRHEQMARAVDEELDQEIFAEVPEDAEDAANGSGGEENGDAQPLGAVGAGRLGRAPDLNDDEMVSALNSAMQKATAHMHDSMIASYIALLIGCLVQTDETMADKLRALMPSGNFSALLEQLERFREFAVLTKVVDVRCIEAIIESLKVID